MSCLRDPEPELVRLPVLGRDDGEVHRERLARVRRPVQVDVEVLVRVDAAEASEARRPDVAAQDQVLQTKSRGC